MNIINNYDEILTQSLGIIDGLFLLLLAVSGNFIAEEVELSGSRINWSAEGYDFLLPGINDRVNFNGTVSGDQLAGTLFSQQGNYTVAGKRLLDSSD